MDTDKRPYLAENNDLSDSYDESDSNESEELNCKESKIKRTLNDHYMISQICIFLCILLFAFCIKAIGTSRTQSLIESYNYYNNDRTVLSRMKNKLYTLADKIPVTRKLKSAYKDAKHIFIADEKPKGGEDIEQQKENKMQKAPYGSSFAPIKLSLKMGNPLENARLTSYFGYRESPINGSYGFHTGIDLAMPTGSSVLSVYDGEVEKTGQSDSFGNYVLVRHSKTIQTFYAHLSAFSCEEGDKVKQGGEIAKVGSTGWSTGPHLHFEVRINEVRVDPLWYLPVSLYTVDV